MVPEKNRNTNSLSAYMTALLCGFIVGSRTVPDLVGVFYLMLALVILYFALENNVQKVLILIPFLIYTEMFIRAYVLWIPYLFMSYFYLLIFSVLIVNQGSYLKIHSRYFVLIIIFLVIEAINGVRTVDAENARTLLVSSCVIGIIGFWASTTVISPVFANKILNSVKLAGIYLCAMILFRYFKGSISFQGYSGSEGTNGLAPVQTSAYLGFSATIFFFSIMNGKHERKNLVINIVALVLSCVFMVLSFSRGGVYFLAVMVALYLLFNRSNFKKYVFLILLLPVGLLTYTYAVEKTNGLIKYRYEQEGASGREELLQAAYMLFMDKPLAGVGLGNFNSEITSNKLYGVNSGAHNEFARVAAEDGILGLVFYWGFFIALLINIFNRNRVQREYAFYFLVFYVLVIIHNGLKISLQPFLLLLAIATPSLTLIKKGRCRNFISAS